MYFSKNDIIMNILGKTIIFFIFLLLYSCANYETNKSMQKEEKKYYTSTGFALIFDDEFYEQGIINKKINNDQIAVMHSFLKKNTPIEIINPDSLNTIETKVTINTNYPKIFNVVISKKIAMILDIDYENPYVIINEIKKNKKFIAKESSMFEEEKNVADKAPVNEVTIDDLNKTKSDVKKNKSTKKNNFIIIISDFYYLDSANKLKQKLSKQTNIMNFSVKKINDNKYRLSVGPFNNFNALKSTYISLNKLGFEDLNVFREL